MKEIKTIIEAFPKEQRNVPANENHLTIAEFFCDTIQGEGINIGHPAAFLRMQFCTMSCRWCDTKEVWRYGNPYTFDEVFDLMQKFDLVNKLFNGQHLVLTGGSPLLQQTQLIAFIKDFVSRHGFKPYIEIENECTIMPDSELVKLIDCWNNSPKLSNSKNGNIIRYQPKIIKYLSGLQNSWFKFVVSDPADWLEIFYDFIIPEHIKREQVILMPQGADRAELERNRDMVIELAVTNNVRYSTREHIVLWDKKTGV